MVWLYLVGICAMVWFFAGADREALKTVVQLFLVGVFAIFLAWLFPELFAGGKSGCDTRFIDPMDCPEPAYMRGGR